MGAKVGIFSKSSPHKVVIPENHIQAFSFEIGSHLVSIPVCCRKDEITAPSPQVKAKMALPNFVDLFIMLNFKRLVDVC